MASKAIDSRMFQTRIDIPAESREALVKLLNKQLAETTDLYSQTKHAHWNVRGKDFFQHHELFDQLADDVFAFIDLIAERATALGGSAMGTIRMSAQHSSLPEYPQDAIDGVQHIQALSERFAHYAKTNREAIEMADRQKDQVTVDLFSTIGRTIDKDLWFLDAHRAMNS